MTRKLPIGIQGFEGLRNDGFVYVDKTEYIYRLAHEGKPYFLSRPRRFGKSLLVSAMKSYWEGKRELFSGLAIERLEAGNEGAFEPHPVFLFDFNGENYRKAGTLEGKLDFLLRQWEEEYYLSAVGDNTLGERLQMLLKRASKKTGRRCVVLVDEYDKPLLDSMGDRELNESNREVLKGFFGALKSLDEYTRFIFITGVSRFHKVSIFSDLNQLRDISMSEDFAGICGITEKELGDCFKEEVSAVARRRGMTEDECRDALRRQYDGYRFCPDGASVYNPYSLLGAFLDKDFGSYWFETGTPTFLIRRLREARFDVRGFTERPIFASESVLKDYTGDSLDPIPLLYQTGYLTIVGHDSKRRRYTLGFPNEEVKYGFLESLMPSYVPRASAANGLDIFTLDEAVENGDLGRIRDVLAGLFANIT